jgi:hypothetical protein
MTLRTNARLAGWMFLAYIVVGLTTVYVGRGTMSGDDTASKLASIATHVTQLRLNMLLGVVLFVVALTLAVSLYGITRDVDHDLSVLAMCCRVAEAVVGFMPIIGSIALLGLATQTPPADTTASYAVVDLLMRVRRVNPTLTATLFAMGSTVFAYLMLRGRMIPTALARLGVAASVLLVAVLPAQLVGFASGLVTQVSWLPMLVFEVTLAVWLIVKGVKPVDAPHQQLQR